MSDDRLLKFGAVTGWGLALVIGFAWAAERDLEDDLTTRMPSMTTTLEASGESYTYTKLELPGGRPGWDEWEYWYEAGYALPYSVTIAYSETLHRPAVATVTTLRACMRDDGEGRLEKAWRWDSHSMTVDE